MTTNAQEKLLSLPDGRTLAYSDSGNASSSTVVLFLHGAFCTGDASHPPSVVLEKDIYYVAPTLPGWGNSSPTAPAAYASTFAADMTNLLNHLCPDQTNLRLYVAGFSFGSAPAQMLYGASFDAFPPGRYIVGLLLMAAFTPFRHHTNYTKSLNMQNYILLGPPSRILPFNLLRLTISALKGKVKAPETAESFYRDTLFGKMGNEEKAAYANWMEESGRVEGQVEREMAVDMVRSVAKTWDGYLSMPDVLHSDWCFRPDALGEEHAKRPILIFTGTTDDAAPVSMGEWLVANYKNARLETVVGGHLATIFYSDEIWREFLEHEG